MATGPSVNWRRHKELIAWSVVGEEARPLGEAAQRAGVAEVSFTANTDDAAQWLAGHSHLGDLILVKGSRSAGMERVLTSLAIVLGKSGEPIYKEPTVPVSIP